MLSLIRNWTYRLPNKLIHSRDHKDLEKTHSSLINNCRLTNSTYYYPSKLTNTDRSIIFGKESKTRLNPKSYIPAPGDYSFRSDFGTNSKKGYTFGH